MNPVLIPTPPRLRTLFSKTVPYVFAVVLPVLSAWATQHWIVLQTMPFALFFLSVTLVAVMYGFVPSAVAVAFCMLAHGYFVVVNAQGRFLTSFDLIRGLVLLAATIIVSLASNSRRNSEQKLEAALLDLHERTDALIQSLNSSKCASWTFDLDSGRSARWYSGSYPVFGRPFDEMEAMPSLLSLLHADDQPRLPQLVEKMVNTWEPIFFEHRVPWPNGEVHWLEMRATRVPGKGCVWRGLTVDITERKLTESALLRSEKLAAMGRIASTVAHEINNPLEAVTNLLYLARSGEPLPETAESYLALAERELARLGNITRLTLGFVRNSGKVSLVDVGPVVDDILTIFRHRLEMKNVHVECHCKPGTTIRIAGPELRQILTNLIANAADALPNAVVAVPPRLTVTVEQQDGRAVILVDDNGSGIDAKDLEHIFDAFFTTKEEVGTGIGLWVTRELVQKHQGEISVESGGLPGGVSTRFRVAFPLAG